MSLNQYVAVEIGTNCRRTLNQSRPIANRDRASTAHFGRCRVLDVQNSGHRARATHECEDVADILHADRYNMNRVDKST